MRRSDLMMKSETFVRHGGPLHSHQHEDAHLGSFLCLWKRFGVRCVPFGVPNKGGKTMAQLVVSWLICNGRLRVHAIKAAGRRSIRIIEIEDIDTGERVHGSARRLERLVQSLQSSRGELDQVSPGASHVSQARISRN